MKNLKAIMKLSSLALSLLLIVPAITVGTCAADAVVSPALGILSKDVTVTVTGMGSANASFSPEVFDYSLGTSVKNITVLTLPDANEGTLLFDGKPVAANQKISRRNIGKLSFRPASSTADASFYVTANGSYATECSVRVIESVNLAPSVPDDAAKLYMETMRGTVVRGAVSIADPEDGEVELVLTKAPKKGTVTINDAANGEFTYSPSEGKSGSDSFSLRARDEYGNWSDEVAVTVRINKNKTGIEYADLADKEAHDDALKMTNAGIMSGKYVDGKAYFYPETNVTREEFVTMLMKTIGLSDIPQIADVGFADDNDISPDARNFVRAAKKLGFINGSKNADGSLVFDPKANVTRAEAAVILQNVIKVKVDDGSVSVFADSDAIPAWAAESILAMKKLGIMSGNGNGAFSPSAAVTRADAASILSSVYDMVE